MKFPGSNPIICDCESEYDKKSFFFVFFFLLRDATREKGPTIQKIDFRIMRDSISFWTDLSISNFFSEIRKFFSLLDRRSLFSDRVTYSIIIKTFSWSFYFYCLQSIV